MHRRIPSRSDASPASTSTSPFPGGAPSRSQATKRPDPNGFVSDLPKRTDGATRAATVTSKPPVDTRLRTLVDRFVPGWSFKQALFVFAHPDDETMMTKTIATLLARGVQVRVIYLTQSNGGTAFTSRSGIQRPTFAASGKEALFSQRYGALRIAQSIGFLSDLAPDPRQLKVDVLSYPDRSPYNAPAERSIRYSQVADWNAAHIVDFIESAIVEDAPSAVFTLRHERAVHPAHTESVRLVQQALEAHRAKRGGSHPVHLSALETGWYERRYLRPLTKRQRVESRYTDDELPAIRALLAKWFGRDGGHGSDAAVPECEQPPGAKRQWDAEVDREVLEAAPDTDRRIVHFFNALLNDSTANDMARATAGTGGSTHAGAAGNEMHAPHVTVHQPQIPADASAQRRRAHGVELMPPATATRHVGPQDAKTQAALPGVVRRARVGIGRAPHAMTEAQREGLAALKAPPPDVPEHTAVRERIANLAPARRREGHRFLAGPRRDTVVYLLSANQMPAGASGARGRGLTLDARTRPFASLDIAREYAITLIKAAPQADVAIYRLAGPADELRRALRSGHVDRALIERAAMVLDGQGTLHPVTIANTSAKYRPVAGTVIGRPPVTGMPRRRMRRAAATAFGKIGATAVATYVSTRYGLGLSHEATMETLLQTGRIMFAARAWINASKRVLEIRLARLCEVVGAERTQRAAALTSGTPTGSPADAVNNTPLLDTLARRTRGLRGIARGYTRRDRAQIALLADVVRHSPDDADAYRLLEGLATGGLFASDSAVERARRAFWGLSYAPSDVAAAGIWLAPEVLFSGIDSVGAAAERVADGAMLMFVPVHLLGNGGPRIARALEKIGRKHHLDPSVPAAGEPLRDFLPGNSDRPRAVRRTLGELLTYARLRPDGGRLHKPALFKRLPEFQMLGAAVASVPFGTANALGAIEAASAGHVGAAALQTAMVAADAAFARGFWHAYENAHGDTHGRGPIVRRGRFAPLSPPVRGARAQPDDITQPHLVAHGFLRRFEPEFVIATGMGMQVALGLMLGS